MPRNPRTPAPYAVAIPLLLVSLSGCLAEQATDEPTPDSDLVPDPTPAEAQLRARVTDLAGETTPYTNDDWFLLATPRSPDGHVRAFAWEVPAGAVQTIPDGPPLPMLFLEFVPFASQFAPGDDWSLFGFRDDGGTAQLMFALIGPTTTVEDLTTDPPQSETVPPPASSASLLVTAPDLADGDRLHFILVGHGAADQDLAFAFRTQATRSPNPPEPANHFGAFVADEPDRPFAPPRTYDGGGSHDAFYLEQIVPEGERRRIISETMDHESETIAGQQGGQVVRQHIMSTATAGPGWSLAVAAHQAFGETSYWTLDIAAQGVAGRANGIAMNDPVGLTGVLTETALGAPNALFMADGDGDSHVRLSFDRASAGTATMVQHHQLPATLETILGIPSATHDDISTGETDGMPWIGRLPPG